MAMIEKIRKRRIFLLVIIGLGMLLFIIPVDAWNALTGNNAQNGVGTIDGTEVSIPEYQSELQAQQDYFAARDRSVIPGQAWTALVDRKVLNKEFEDLGMRVSEEELDNIRFSNDATPHVRAFLYNNQAPTPELVENWRRNFSADFENNKRRWSYLTSYISFNRNKEKFNDLLNNGYFANDLDAKYDFRDSKQTVDFDYVLKRFTVIPDSLVTVTDNDLKKFYEAHKTEDKYAQKNTRKFKYIAFDTTPSDEDSLKIKEDLGRLAGAFKSAEDDSAFVVKNSALKRYTARRYRAETNKDADVDAAIIAAEVGTVVGPFLENGKYRLAKKIANEEEEELKARHILIKEKEGFTKEDARAQIDSLKAVIAKEDNFAEMAKQFGEDGTKAQGGDLGWFGRKKMVPEFTEAVFDAKIGELVVIDSQFGIHLAEVLEERSTPEYVLAQIETNIEPQDDTVEEMRKKAKDFQIEHSDNLEEFEFAAKSLGYVVLESKDVTSNTKGITGIPDAQGIISWAFGADNELEDVSRPLLAGNTYVVACLTSIKEKGIPPFENAKETMRAEVLKEKKAELFVQKMGEAKNLDEVVAVSGRGAKISSESAHAFNNDQISGAGREPKVVGAAFAIEKGFISEPIVGEFGIYVIKPTSNISVEEDKTEWTAERTTLKSRNGNKGSSIISQMKKEANVEDNRSGQ